MNLSKISSKNSKIYKTKNDIFVLQYLSSNTEIQFFDIEKLDLKEVAPNVQNPNVEEKVEILRELILKNDENQSDDYVTESTSEETTQSSGTKKPREDQIVSFTLKIKVGNTYYVSSLSQNDIQNFLDGSGVSLYGGWELVSITNVSEGFNLKEWITDLNNNNRNLTSYIVSEKISDERVNDNQGFLNFYDSSMIGDYEIEVEVTLNLTLKIPVNLQFRQSSTSKDFNQSNFRDLFNFEFEEKVYADEDFEFTVTSNRENKFEMANIVVLLEKYNGNNITYSPEDANKVLTYKETNGGKTRVYKMAKENLGDAQTINIYIN